MSRYQLIALDMDGTLLNSEKKISPKNLQALEKAAAAGKDLVLSTGRCRPELEEYIRQIPGLKYLDCTSGALVYDVKERREIFRRGIEPPVVRRLLELAKMENAMMHLLDRESVVQTNQWTRMEDYGMGAYKPMYARIVTSKEDLYQSYCENPFPVEKINLYHTDMASRERTRRRVLEEELPVEMVYAESSSLEFNAKGIDKGAGLEALCSFLKLPLEKTIAVGDADNDLAILRCAGLAVAMGNANENVKKIAGAVVADCDHDGCAEAIEKYLLS